MSSVALIPVFTLVVSLLAASPAMAQGGRNGRPVDRVCVYENNNFQGWEQCYEVGDDVNDLQRYNNAISSIRIFGNAVLTIYDNKNFSGQSVQITSDVKDLAQMRSGGFNGLSVWNDRVESLRVSQPGGRPDPRDNRYSRGRPDTDNVICVYEEKNFRGAYDCFAPDQDTSDLKRYHDGWNDRIASIRVFGNARATAFLDIKYRGEQLAIDNDIPDLSRMRTRDGRNWNRQISSLEISGGRSYRR
jgi:hypothetical protein